MTKARVICLLALCLAAESFAAKKDFKGLFGSYRREKFTENEGKPSDFGMDIMLSTLLPISTIVSSTEVRGATGNPMAYATFFNVEMSFFYTLNYNWEIYLNTGYYSFDTRQRNATPGPTPQFHVFEMSAIPATLGVKYRFSRSDIVPYLGVGAGLMYAHREASYDYTDTAKRNVYSTSFTAQGVLGVEFFIAPRAGIRLETSAMYLGMPVHQFDYGATPTNFPIFDMQANPIAVRYASGLFILF